MKKSDAPNWHIDPKALAAYYELSGVQPLSGEGATRVLPIFGEAEGFREVYELATGFQLVTGDITCHKEATLKLKSDGSLKFHFRLEGFSGWGLPNEQERQITRYSMGVLLSPPGTEKSEHYLEGEHERSVTLICESNFLQPRFSAMASQLPATIGAFVTTGEARHFNQKLPMTTEAISAANLILENSYRGSLKRQYIEARALELLVLSLAACVDYEENLDNPHKGMTDKDIDRMHKARDILEKDYVAPPTINQLARLIGLNEAKLMQDFKQLYGQTIFDFTQNIRMDEAKRLLETTSKSITEIALDVGYEYSSNFTTAFKRRFGVPPSVAREAHKP